MKYIYVIVVKGKDNSSSINIDAYSSILDAQKFIESRSDNPQRITGFRYKSDLYEYQIHELIIN